MVFFDWVRDHTALVTRILLIYWLRLCLFVWLRLSRLDNGLRKDDDPIKLVVEQILQLILLFLRVLVVNVAFKCDQTAIVGDTKEINFVD